MKLLSDKEICIAEYKQGKSPLIWCNYFTDIQTPLSAYMKLRDSSKYHCLFESVVEGKQRSRYSVIALMPDMLWRVQDGVAEIADEKIETNSPIYKNPRNDIFGNFREFIKTADADIPNGLPPMSSGIFGMMCYDMVKYMEDIPDDNPDNINIPDALYFRPKLVMVFDSVMDKAIIVSTMWNNKNLSAEDAYNQSVQLIKSTIEKLLAPLSSSQMTINPDLPQLDLEFTSNMDQETYIDAVNKAKEYIIAGDIFQVVPSRRFETDFSYDALALYRSLRHLNPSPYMFHMNLNDYTLVGSSPEILVRLEDKKVTLRPLAGTRKRGQNEAEDLALAKDLLDDPKELAEHLMLLDLGRNDVGRVVETGSVEVTKRNKVEYYSHVMHIVSNVEGKLATDKDAVDALIAGFPAGTVSGAPKIRAMEIIDELETLRRSFYSGTVGYFSSNGDMDNCIALRTGLVKDGKLYLQAGGGVVADSNPIAEFEETENKSRALKRAASMANIFA